MEQYVAKVTEIMREADQLFETTGGGTRHYVRDLLLPMMEQAGLKIVDAATPSPAKAEQENQNIDDSIEKETTRRWNSLQYNPEGVTKRDSIKMGVMRDMLFKMDESTTPPVKTDWEAKYKEANEFIIDLAKELGQEGLGYDDLSWTIEDFMEAARTKFEAPVKQVAYDELWDEFSEHVDDDIDSLSMFAGRSVLTETQYNKLITKLKEAPVKEDGQPVDGPWKFEHVHVQNREDADEYTILTDGKVTLYIDQHEEEDGEQELVNLLNKLKAKLDWDRSDEFMMHEYERMFKESCEFIREIGLLIGAPNPSAYTVDDVKEAIKTKP